MFLPCYQSYLLLSCQQSLAVNPVCLAQEDPCRFFPCVEQVCLLLWTHLGHGPSFWDLHGRKRLLLIHSFSRCKFMGFNNLKHLLGTLCPCAMVPGLLVYSVEILVLVHPMISVRLCLSAESLYLGEESQPSLFLSIFLFYLCLLSSLWWERGRYMFLHLQGQLNWCCISTLNIKVAEMVYVAKQ